MIGAMSEPGAEAKPAKITVRVEMSDGTTTEFEADSVCARKGWLYQTDVTVYPTAEQLVEAIWDRWEHDLGDLADDSRNREAKRLAVEALAGLLPPR
jgi:hypothetical protein